MDACGWSTWSGSRYAARRASPPPSISGSARAELFARSRARSRCSPRRPRLPDTVMAETDLVTGGTGFVGANLVRELLADGRAVRVLARKGGDRRALEGCAVEVVDGDLL